MVKTMTQNSTAHRNHKPTFDPFTPISKLFRSSKRSERVEKRGRAINDELDLDQSLTSSPLDPVVPTPPSRNTNDNHLFQGRSRTASKSSNSASARSSRHSHTRQRSSSTSNRIALQSEDEEEDAVIITTLDTVPFCCHEDLLTMTHAQLRDVARSLNTKLPVILHIDTENTDTFIRNSIEVLVGIKKGTPMKQSPAPPRTYAHHRSFSGVSATSITAEEDDDDDDDESEQDILANMSPLGKRGRRSSMFGSPCVTPRLARLDEEEENELSDAMDRPFKKRRLSDADDADVEIGRPNPKHNRRVSFDLGGSPTTRLAQRNQLSSTSLTRTRHRRNSAVDWSHRTPQARRNTYRASSLSFVRGSAL